MGQGHLFEILRKASRNRRKSIPENHHCTTVGLSDRGGGARKASPFHERKDQRGQRVDRASCEKKEPLLSSNFFSIFSPNKEKEKDNVEKNLAKTSQIEWEKQVENLIAEVEQIQFTEEELDYLESFIDEDLNEYVFNNFENIE